MGTKNRKSHVKYIMFTGHGMLSTFGEVCSKAIFLVYNQHVAILKYNFRRHFATQHMKKYRDLLEDKNVSRAEALLAKIQIQERLFFTKLLTC